MPARTRNDCVIPRGNGRNKRRVIKRVFLTRARMRGLNDTRVIFIRARANRSNRIGTVVSELPIVLTQVAFNGNVAPRSIYNLTIITE